jgi:hypothetical protein
VTLLAKPDYKHNLIDQPSLDFRNFVLDKALGPNEFRTRKLANNHLFFKDIFKTLPFKNFLEAKSGSGENIHEQLQIYRDQPINLRFNVISNPLLNAEIMAQDIAHALKKGFKLFNRRTFCCKDLQAISKDNAVNGIVNWKYSWHKI